MRALELGCWKKCPETEKYDEVYIIGLEEGTEKNYIKMDVERELEAGRKLPFPDNYFDFIWSHAVIEHFIRPIEIMRELVRVIKVGGKIVVHVPNCYDAGQADGDITHYSRFGRTSMDGFKTDFRIKGYLGLKQNCHVKATVRWYAHSIQNSWEGNKLGKLVDKFMTWFINKYPRLYDAHLFWLTAWIHVPEEIEFVIEKVSE